MARIVPPQKGELFILQLFNMTISDDLGKGLEILPGIKITNNSSVINSLITPFLRTSIGELEYSSLQTAKVVLYSNDHKFIHPGDFKPTDKLTRLLDICRLLLLFSWFVKDNSINFELGFLQYLSKGIPFVSSNFLTYKFYDSRAETIVVDFSKQELEDLVEFSSNFSPRLVYKIDEKKYDRLAIVINYLDIARGSHTLGMKIAFYCVCLEALFSVDTSELSHKIAERVAFFAGETPQERIQIYQNTKSAYSIRSKIVHGDVLAMKPSDSELNISIFCDDILRRIIPRILTSNELLKIFNSNNKALERFLIDMTFGATLIDNG